MVWTLLLLILLIAGGWGYARYLERKSLYNPTYTMEVNPGDFQLVYEDVFFNAADNAELNGWYVPAKDSRITVVFCHGNGGNISHRIDKIDLFNEMGADIFIFDYRGFGKSRGRSSEEGLYADVLAACRYARKKNPHNRLVIYGESLGGAIAMDAASRGEVDGLVLEAAFTNIRDMSHKLYPFLPTVFLQTRFDSLDKMPKVKCPKLIMHSPADDVVPYEMGKRLFAAAAEPKTFLEISGQHNDCFLVSENLITWALSEFFAEIEQHKNSV